MTLIRTLLYQLSPTLNGLERLLYTTGRLILSSLLVGLVIRSILIRVSYFTPTTSVIGLVRLLKDLKRRFIGFNHLNPWQIVLLVRPRFF